jgi:pimeloyl-ACP methyl ester carboxylesterase
MKKPMDRRLLSTFTLFVLLFLFGIGYAPNAIAQAKGAHGNPDVRDAALVRSLPGFENGYAEVNGTRIHYVVGGKGTPLFLLPGWPETWWHYHRIMPALAREFRVIAVDIRGMGGSAKPASGYDKKTMARDIYELAKKLGYRKVNMAGHDIGSMVAFSFAANHPEATLKLALMDVPHPDDFFSQMRLLPEHGKFGDKIDEQHPGYPWWFAFHQVKGLPEKVLAGRMGIYQDFIMDYLLQDSASIDAKDRAVYHAAYASAEAIRAGDAWYQTFTQDVIDMKTYPKLTLPVLGLGSTGYDWLKASVTPAATNFKLVKVENSGHFMAEEQPEFVTRALIEFFK